MAFSNEDRVYRHKLLLEGLMKDVLQEVNWAQIEGGALQEAIWAK